MVSELEKRFEDLWLEIYPDIDLEAEFKLIPKRKYRFDFVNQEAKVAIEINGQIWVMGGHNSGKGLLRDYEKNNLAIAQGYVVFMLSSEMITEEWIRLIGETIKKRI